MCSIVGPAVINTFLFFNTDENPNFFETYSKTSSGSDAFAFPSIICGARNSILFFRNSIFFFTAELSYIDSCIAKHIKIGIFDPNPTVSTVEIGVSSIPFANFPNVFAVAGYTIIRSD